MPLFELLIDFFLAALLLATLFYCRILNQRIRVLQDSRGELSKLLKHFDASTRRASDSIAVLQSTSRKAMEVMQARIDRAIVTADDLNFLIDRAEKAAESLEAGINVSRSAKRVQEEMAVPRSAPQPDDQRLMRAAVQQALADDLPEMPPAKSAAVSSLQAMIERLAARNAPDARPQAPQRPPRAAESRVRSRVEQELLEIIRAGKE